MRRSHFAAILLVVLPCAAYGQVIRGTVTDSVGAGVLTGVVVTLLDVSGAARSRALTSEEGEYRLVAPGPGTYRVRTLRIGYQAATSGPITLAAGEERAHPLALRSIPLELEALRVVSRSSCDRGSDAAGTLALWEQVRAALAAAQLSEGSRVNEARLVTYERALDPQRDRVVQQRVSVKSGPTRRPWVSWSMDSLRRAGYVVTHLDGSTSYHAPDLSILLADEFIADHCLRVVAGQDAARIGIAFEPTPERRRIPGIAGTLWLDRRTTELRDMDFRYVNTSRAQALARPGGSMRFVRLRSGNWLIAGWSIRMPQTAMREERVRPDMPAERVPYVHGIRVEGGELVMVTRRNDTLWARPPLHLKGRVQDSATGRPVAAAIVSLRGTAHSDTTNTAGDFSIADVLPGEYMMEVTTAALERLGVSFPRLLVFTDSSTTVSMQLPDTRNAARRICPDTNGAVIAGLVRGVGELRQLPGALVMAEWTNASGVDWSEARSNSRGRYALCGIPEGASVTVRVMSDSGTTAPRRLQIPTGERVAIADLVIDRFASEAAFSGVVLSSTNAQELEGVEIRFDSLQRSVHTDRRGRFVMYGIPAGTHRVTVRRIGYDPLTEALALPAMRKVERQFALSAVATLATVEVRDSVGALDTQRALGLGHFLTRADLAKFPGKPLHMALNTMPGANVLRGAGTGTTIVSGRIRPTGGQLTGMQPKNAACNGDEPSLRGMPCACYPQVYVGESLVNPGTPTPPANINEFTTDRVESVEWYASPIHVPAKYHAREAECGVLVINLRRK